MPFSPFAVGAWHRRGRGIAGFGWLMLGLFVHATAQTSGPAVVVLPDVPYVHQYFDTADDFGGGESCCNVAAAIMAIQYYERLPAHPITCSRGGVHASDYGFYLSNSYTYEGHAFDVPASAVWGASLAGYRGAFGYFLQDAAGDGARRATRLAEYIALHGIVSAVDTDVAGERGFTKICAEIDAGHPVVVLAGLAPAGHYLTCTGYLTGQHTLVFNDPAGDHRTGYPNGNGAGVRYDWPGWNHGNDSLVAVPRVLYARAERPSPARPIFTAQPQSQTGGVGASVRLTATVEPNPASSYEWRCNGRILAGANEATLLIPALTAGQVGLYTIAAGNAATTITSEPAIVGLAITDKVSGYGQELAANVRHPNGNTYDQVQLSGAAVAVTAEGADDPSQMQVTRVSFVDLDDDIVQVEFSGPGTLSLVLDAMQPAAPPLKYHQPGVSYVKGHAGIVITDADERTNLCVFAVGRATAFDPTGAYNLLVAADAATNNPANNGSPLFYGHEATVYDGIADLAFVAILSRNGRFGSVRTGNAVYFAARGVTGLFAPTVTFEGQVLVGDMAASDSARPCLIVGSAPDVRVTGGGMFQPNGLPVAVSGVGQVRFVRGSDAHGRALPAQANRAVFLQDGRDVTAELVVNPAP